VASLQRASSKLSKPPVPYVILEVHKGIFLTEKLFYGTMHKKRGDPRSPVFLIKKFSHTLYREQHSQGRQQFIASAGAY
jgi:hypothetical protein